MGELNESVETEAVEQNNDVSRETSESLWDASDAKSEVSEEISPKVSENLDEEAEATVEAWYLAEGLEGTGDAPDWFKAEKYKNVADQAKAYTELEKKFGEFRGAPKDGYDFDALGEDGVNPEDPLIKHFGETFKELNLTQEGFNRVIQEFYEVQKMAVNSSTSEEMEKLGKDGAKIVTQVDTWLNNTFDKQTAETVKGWVTTAEDMKALQTIQSFQPRSEIPMNNSVNFTPYESLKEVTDEKTANWERYNSDESYRNSLSKRLYDAHARETSGRKRA